MKSYKHDINNKNILSSKKNATKQDTIFMQDYNEKFEFNNLVASVFDDMIERSVPFYEEMMNLSIYFILENLKDWTHTIQKTDSVQIPIIYDLGSSTGNLLLRLYDTFSTHNICANLYGIDNSLPMIERAKLKANALGADITFLHQDFLQTTFLPADIITAFYTLQFIRPIHRQNMIQKIYNVLKEENIFMASLL
ncbi:hypothetical protein CQA53_04270 [Helicobacter didelphidarum]|uniref:Methyltransferase domain-containing protein n=1 Tax=Helicobacter didelphidarum TaxID=2040648 RepID=A0A3D8IM87_9HELI|nr:class I SAM-dependent methyltransferase [Helicobacter didelphidarum]RDU66233.1 hypothetical protein CQA53_04270 [Helicobacter didelphidarum]